jgi:hypothetical protein
MSVRELHHHASGRSDNLPSQENVLHPECFDLLPEFRNGQKNKFDQRTQIVGKHHPLKDCFIGLK